MAPPNRKGGGGLSLRTLVIASAASLTAAIVTSRLFPSGTVYASAMTPVIVAAVSELLNRPVDRVAILRDQRRTLVLEERRHQGARVLGQEADPLLGAPSFAQGADAPEEPVAPNGNGHHRGGDPLAGVEIHGRPRRPRILHPKVWIVTGLLAFAITVAVLTLPELIFGGAVATSHQTTFFGGGAPAHHSVTHTTTTKSQSTPAQTTTSQTPTQSTPTTTTGTTTTDTTTTQTSTSGGAPAPTPTDTSTGPLPPAP